MKMKMMIVFIFIITHVCVKGMKWCEGEDEDEGKRVIRCIDEQNESVLNCQQSFFEVDEAERKPINAKDFFN